MEVPQPLLDRRIWEFAMRVPLEEFVRDGMPRALYRRAMSGVLPEKILTRTSKGWYAADFLRRIKGTVSYVDSFLDQKRSEPSIWSYLNREAFGVWLQNVRNASDGNSWDPRFQTLGITGLRTAQWLSLNSKN